MTALSGIITVATAGTAQQGPAAPSSVLKFAIKAHPDNTDTVWIGNDGAGDVAATNGFPLNPGEGVVVKASTLSAYWFDSDVNGEKICWLLVE